MGVQGLWQLLNPAGRPVSLESLEGKVLAVDVSIWLHQAAKGMRDSHGSPLPNAHLHSLFTRVCKLLHYRIKPVFVFDGGVPYLKKQTLARRRERKERAEEESNKATAKLLQNLIRSHAVKTALGESGESSAAASLATIRAASKGRDIFDLPPLPEADREYTSALNYDDNDEDPWDSRLQYHSIVQDHFQSLEDIDIDSEQFHSLPGEVKHELLTDMKEVRRQRRLGRTAVMPENSDDFSTFQMSRLIKQSKLTNHIDSVRKEMNAKTTADFSTALTKDYMAGEFEAHRVVSEDASHYILIKGLSKQNQIQQAAICESIVSDAGRKAIANAETEEDKKLLDEPDELLIECEKEAVEEKVPKDSRDNDCCINIGPDVFPSDSGELAVGGSDSDVSTEMPTVESSSLKVTSGQSLGDQIKGGKPALSMEMSTVESSSSKVTSGQPLGDHAKGGKPALKRNSDVGNEGENPKVSKLKDVSKTMQDETDEISDSDDEGFIEISINPAAVEEDELFPADMFTVSEPTDNLKSQTSVDIIQSGHAADIPSKNMSAHTKLLEPEAGDVTESTSAAMDAESESTEIRDRISALESKINKLVSKRREDAMRQEFSGRPGGQSVSGDVGSQLESNIESSEENEMKEVQPAEREDLKKSKQMEFNIGDYELDESDDDDPMAAPSGHVDIEPEAEVEEPSQEFQGMSRADLEDMHIELEQESGTLRAERGKQDRLATSISDQMNIEAQELLRLFGIPYVVSPMEAEAQCAELDVLGLTHGTITDDSDIWLFGGSRVYKHFFNQKKSVEFFNLSSIQAQFGLNRDKLIAFAYLCGSDYTEGIPGVGMVTALEILGEFQGEGIQGLLDLKSWWDRAQKLTKKTMMSKVKTKVKDMEFQEGFPNHAVVDAYLHPTVDESEETFAWASPDLDLLRDFASEKMGWNKQKTDDILLPVLKRLNKKESQGRISSYFQPEYFMEPGKITSKRVQHALDRVKGKVEPEIPKSKGTMKERLQRTKEVLGMPKSRKKGRGKGRGRGKGANTKLKVEMKDEISLSESSSSDSDKEGGFFQEEEESDEPLPRERGDKPLNRERGDKPLNRERGDNSMVGKGKGRGKNRKFDADITVKVGKTSAKTKQTVHGSKKGPNKQIVESSESESD